jgi:lysozyme
MELMADSRDLRITVYSGHLLKEQLGDTRNDLLASNTDFWLAQYTDGTPTWPTGTYPDYALWQFSETGIIDGIEDTNVDLNQYNGSDDELVRWISPTHRKPKPSPQPPKGSVEIGVTASDGVEVMVTVNGDDVLARRRMRHRMHIPRGPDLSPWRRP